MGVRFSTGTMAESEGSLVKGRSGRRWVGQVRREAKSEAEHQAKVISKRPDNAMHSTGVRTVEAYPKRVGTSSIECNNRKFLAAEWRLSPQSKGCWREAKQGQTPAEVCNTEICRRTQQKTRDYGHEQ